MHYQKKFSDITWQPQQYLVSLLRYFKLCFCTQGLENSVETGICCSVSNIQQVGVCALTSVLTKALSLYGWDGAEYNSLMANNACRLSLHGFSASRSPILLGKV